MAKLTGALAAERVDGDSLYVFVTVDPGATRRFFLREEGASWGKTASQYQVLPKVEPSYTWM